MNKEVKNTNAIDVILAVVGSIVLVGLYLVLRFGFGLDPTAIELDAGDKLLINILAISFIILFMALVENLTRWTRLSIIWLGERSYRKKNIDGFPIDEGFIGYQYVDCKDVIKETCNIINNTNDMDGFEDTVWFVNMENRQKAYNYFLRGERKKLSKKFKKANKKRLEDEMELYTNELSRNRDDLGITNTMLVAINQYNNKKVIELDTYLYEKYDIKSKEFDAQDLLDGAEHGYQSWFDRVRNSRVYIWTTLLMIPMTIGVIGIVVGPRYEWAFDDILSKSEVILLNMLSIYLATRIPSVIIKTYGKLFPNSILKPIQDAAFVFKKYTNRKSKTIPILTLGTIIIPED